MMEEQLNRQEIIDRINQLLGVEDNNKLEWATLCQNTDFDSFATAFAFGLNWQDSNMQTMPLSHLKMAMFNLLAFPKKIAA